MILIFPQVSKIFGKMALKSLKKCEDGETVPSWSQDTSIFLDYVTKLTFLLQTNDKGI